MSYFLDETGLKDLWRLIENKVEAVKAREVIRSFADVIDVQSVSLDVSGVDWSAYTDIVLEFDIVGTQVGEDDYFRAAIRLDGNSEEGAYAGDGVSARNYLLMAEFHGSDYSASKYRFDFVVEPFALENGKYLVCCSRRSVTYGDSNRVYRYSGTDIPGGIAYLMAPWCEMRSIDIVYSVNSSNTNVMSLSNIKLWGTKL